MVTVPSDGNKRLIQATRIARRLASPAEALFGTQQLLLKDAAESAPPDAIGDLEKVLEAAKTLTSFVHALQRNDVELNETETSAARLRHDLRTPINAIIGYSELVMEDFADELSASVRSDIETVLQAARKLLSEIEMVGDWSEREDDAMANDLAVALKSAEAARRLEIGRILVVDDEPANRDVLIRQLERNGHQVRSADSVKAAVKLLESTPFDLALVDILMPEANGIELLSQIKGDPRWRDMAVVMVSGLTETEAIAACISAGADDYLPKPIDPVLLHARTNACLERGRWRAREKGYLSQIENEKQRADSLLRAILPAPVITRLNDGENEIVDRFDEASIVFADIVGFTPLVAKTEPVALVRELAALFETFDDIADGCGVEKIKTIGDAYMVASGIPHPRSDHAHAALDFARQILSITSNAKHGMRLRIGINTGPVIAGLIGRRRFVYDVWGDTVNLASRLESTGIQGRIHVSEATLHALGQELAGVKSRTHNVKGVGRITSYFMEEVSNY